MKNRVTFILLTVALFMFNDKCHGQFLKKLGKSIEKASKEVDKVLGTEGTTGTSSVGTNESKITVSTPHKNLKVNLIGAGMSGDNYVLEFTITNKGDDIKDYRLSGYGSGNTDAYDNLGNQCRVDIIFGRNESWHGGSAGGGLLNDTPTKIKILLSRFSSKATSFTQIKVKGEAWDHGYTNRPDGYFVFKNVPIVKNEEQEVVIPAKEAENRVAETNLIVDKIAAEEARPAETDYTLSKDQMNGWKAEMLFGKVQSVKYSTGKQIFFNTIGNPVKIINGKNIITKTYTASNPIKNSDKLKITYGKNTRQIQDYFGILDQCGYSESYMFDNLGRVAGKQLREGCSDNYEEKYIYNGTADRFPSIMKGSEHWETGDWEVTRTYQYIEFDNNGNWTKRKVNEVTKNNDYETEKKSSETKNYVETAIYVYY